MVIKEYGDSELPKVVLRHPMFADADIRYKTAVFDGTPMYENAKFIYQLMKFGFLKKNTRLRGCRLLMCVRLWNQSTEFSVSAWHKVLSASAKKVWLRL